MPVLEDRTTTPVTYQLYLHLAQDSIPATLRVIGAQVRRGQFIGVADDTGKVALVGDVFVDEPRLKAPKPIQSESDLDSLRELLGL